MKTIILSLAILIAIAIAANADLVSFVPPLPEGWLKVAEKPVSDSKGSLGNIAMYQSHDQKQSIAIQVSGMDEKDLAMTFEKSAQDWKEGCLALIRDLKREPQEIDFKINQTGKQPEAELSFQVQGNQNILNYFAKFQRTKNKMVNFVAIGKGVKTKGDVIIDGIMKSAVVN